MNRPLLPPLHDLLRAYDTTIDGTVRRLLDYYERRPGSFTYNPARRNAAPAFAHGVVQPQVRAAVTSYGSPAGRKQNLEVVDHIWDAGEGRTMSCYPIRHGLFPIRHDLAIRVPADFLFVEDRTPNIFWVQPRRGFALTELGLGALASIFRMTFLVDDLAGAGIELLDVSAPQGVRLHVRHTLATLPSLSDADVTAVVQQLVQAYDEVCAMERDWEARRATRAAPTAEPGLFG